MEVVETTVVVEEVVVEESSVGIDAVAEEQIAAAQALVESLKQEQLSSVASTKTIKKRVISDVTIDDEPVPTTVPATLHDALVADNRGMFGKIFRRAPAGSKRGPAHPSRVIRAGGSQIALVEREVEAELQRPERRWIAGLGLALAIGATAAAPYLLG